MPELDEWESFYLIVGGAAGALIGLQFVVMTLIAEKPPVRTAESSAAFGTPTIVHFSAALLLSAVLRAPWQTITSLAVLWGLAGLGGVTYSAVVVRRMRKQSTERPVGAGGGVRGWRRPSACAGVAGSALAAPSHLREALFGVGGAVLLLLFIGIHNAWDAVAYLVNRRNSPR
jgi:hypothetical protein